MYTLRRTWEDKENDFVFRYNRRDVGRTYLTKVPMGNRWLWTIYGSSRGGLEDTLDEAKQRFRQTFEAEVLSKSELKSR